MTAATDRLGVDGKTIGEMLANRAAATPSAPAFMSKRNGSWQTATWQQAYEKASDIAHGLLALGLKPGDKVAIIGGTREEWCLSDFGLLLAGGVTVPIYQSSLRETVSYILNDSESIYVFAEDKKQLDKLLAIRAEIPNVRQVFLWDGHAEGDRQVDEWVTPLRELCDKGRGHRVQEPNALPEVRGKQSGSDLATIIYTSGTTGNPKGVIVAHEAFTMGTKYGVQALPVQPHDTQVLFLPLAHSFAKMLEIVAVRVGFCTAFSGIDNLVDNLGEVKPTFMAGVPRIYEKVYSGFLSKAKEGGALKWKLVSWAIEVGTAASREIQAGRKPGGLLAVQYALADKLVFSKLRARFGGRLRWFVSGSAPLSRELAEFFHAAGMLILEGYGLTETNSLTSVNRADKYKFGTVGPALSPELQVRIAPDGEILTKGVTNLRGYYKQPEATADAIDADGWFHTGDIGEIDEDGFIKITDRKKDLIKTSGGKYVAPQLIEGQLKLDPLVSQAVVIGDQKKYVTALVALNSDVAKKHLAELGESVPGDAGQLIAHPAIQKRIQGRLDEINRKLGSWEQVKYFRTLPRELSENEGELTPTLKVKRKVVSERYRELIDSMYRETGKDKD
ncbi:MAG: long-chain fatty acid--CoA ligase [Polyangia bacterium]